MSATTLPLIARVRAATLRERWLRLLRDLYALPDVHMGMDDILPDTALTRLVLIRGGATAPQRVARGGRKRRPLRLVVESRRQPEPPSWQPAAPTQGDGDDIETPHAPPPPPAADPSAPVGDPALRPRTEPWSPADAERETGEARESIVPTQRRETDLH